MSVETIQPEILALRERLFRQSPTRRQLMAKLERLWDGRPEADVLDATADESISRALRAKAPDSRWTVLTSLPQQAELFHAAGFPDTSSATPPTLPFEANSMDVVLASDQLEHIETPAELIEEFHRILRPKTRLILHVRRKRKSLLPLFRTWAGLFDPFRPAVHAGFTPEELFLALKDGFDVQEEIGFGRFFTELTEILAELFAGVVPGSCEPAALDERRLRRAATVFYIFTPFFYLAAFLDAVCFFLPTHHVILRARRRMLWAPRMAPRLKDGRSIAEAALGSKIGTATE